MKLLLTITLALIFIFILSFCLYRITREENWREFCEVLTVFIIMFVSFTLSAWIVSIMMTLMHEGLEDMVVC